MTGHDLPADLPAELTSTRELPALRIDLTQVERADADVESAELDAPELDATELDATDSLLERLSLGRATADDVEDPAVEMLSELVRVIELDAAARRPVDLQTIMRRAAAAAEPTRAELDPARAELDPAQAELDPAQAELDPAQVKLDPVIWLEGRTARRAGSMRHAKVERRQARTIRLTPLAAAAAAAGVLVAGALFVDTTTQDGDTTASGAHVTTANVIEAKLDLQLAKDAFKRGDQAMAKSYVEAASRMLPHIPQAQIVSLAQYIKKVATQIGVTPPPIVQMAINSPGDVIAHATAGGPALFSVQASPSPTTGPSGPPALPPPTPTPAPSEIPTPTPTPTETPTPTPTETPTPTPTETPTPTPTETPTPTDTLTPTPTLPTDSPPPVDTGTGPAGPGVSGGGDTSTGAPDG